MARFQKRRARKVVALPEISLTPLIDTVLVLLVIFMVSVPVVQQAIKVTVPQAEGSDIKGKLEDIYVYFDKERKLYVNKDKVSEETLVDEVKKKLRDPQKQMVFVNADGSLSWQDVARIASGITSKLKKGGIIHVALSTRRNTNSAAA